MRHHTMPEGWSDAIAMFLFGAALLAADIVIARHTGVSIIAELGRCMMPGPGPHCW